MSELKATRGPWELIEVPRGFIVTADERSYDVATVRNVGNHDNKANAALIAAAPEIYAALEQMHSMWSAHCRANGWEPDHVAESANAIAALQKARGE